VPSLGLHLRRITPLLRDSLEYMPLSPNIYIALEHETLLWHAGANINSSFVQRGKEKIQKPSPEATRQTHPKAANATRKTDAYHRNVVQGQNTPTGTVLYFPTLLTDGGLWRSPILLRQYLKKGATSVRVHMIAPHQCKAMV